MVVVGNWVFRKCEMKVRTGGLGLWGNRIFFNLKITNK